MPTSFQPPAKTGGRGRKAFTPSDDAKETALRIILARQWCLIDETAHTYKGAGRYIRGWKAALDPLLPENETLRSVTFAVDARTGEKVDVSRDDEQRDGVVWRVGLALSSTPQS